MTLTKIENANIEEVKAILGRLLTEGILSLSVRRLAEAAIVSGQSPIFSISAFVRTTFPYIPDPEWGELFVHPNRMAEDYFDGRIRGEDCDGHTLMTAAMLGSVGERVRIALVDSDFDGDIDHAVAQAYSPVFREWITLDTTSKLPFGWKEKVRSETYVYPK